MGWCLFQKDWLTLLHVLIKNPFRVCTHHFVITIQLHPEKYHGLYTAQRAPGHTCMQIDLFVISREPECCPHSKTCFMLSYHKHWIALVKAKASYTSATHSPLTHSHICHGLCFDLRTEMLRDSKPLQTVSERGFHQKIN